MSVRPAFQSETVLTALSAVQADCTARAVEFSSTIGIRK